MRTHSSNQDPDRPTPFVSALLGAIDNALDAYYEQEWARCFAEDGQAEET